MCTKACSKVAGSQAAFITDDAINDGCVCTRKILMEGV